MTHTHSDLLRGRTKFRPLRALAGLLAPPALIIAGLVIFGQPGLRLTYTWDGDYNDPRYFSCDYITVTDWKTKSGRCALVEFFPVEIF